MIQTTLCYLEKDSQYLMLHRVKKHHDVNAGKWIGVGGHMEPGETPEQCIKREVWEETGLTLLALRFRGIIEFYNDQWDNEIIYLYTSDSFSGKMKECDEGVLKWVPKKDLMTLRLWEGDRIFLDYLLKDIPFFQIALHYRGDQLVSWKLYPAVILASSSPRRKQLLRQVGICPKIIPSRIQEKTSETEPSRIVSDLSRQKADDVLRQIVVNPDLIPEASARELPGVFLLAADTVVSADGQVLGKPSTHEEAAAMIRLLSGRIHQVFTGVTIKKLVYDPDKRKIAAEWTKTFAEKTDVKVFPMSEDDIQDYSMSEEPMDKAGGYGIQGTFAAYIESISGDYTNVVGLPVGRVSQIMREALKRK